MSKSITSTQTLLYHEVGKPCRMHTYCGHVKDTQKHNKLLAPKEHKHVKYGCMELHIKVSIKLAKSTQKIREILSQKLKLCQLLRFAAHSVCSQLYIYSLAYTELRRSLFIIYISAKS